jgi:ABC-type Fe3+-citrate transport system substrate-binding protein
MAEALEEAWLIVVRQITSHGVRFWKDDPLWQMLAARRVCSLSTAGRV